MTAPGAAAISIETPLRKGSVLDAGRERTRWVGAEKSGRNCTDPRVMWVLGSNEEAFSMVNSPQRKKPAKASVIAARKLTLLRSSEEFASQRRRSKSMVMGSFGFLKRSPW